MASESFDIVRKRVLREYRHSIIRSALAGHRNKGRGLVLVKFTPTPKSGMVHLSYLTLGTLKMLQAAARPEDSRYGTMLVEKISGYCPSSEIPVVFTDGQSEKFSFGIRKAAGE